MTDRINTRNSCLVAAFNFVEGGAFHTSSHRLGNTIEKQKEEGCLERNGELARFNSYPFQITSRVVIASETKRSRVSTECSWAASRRLPRRPDESGLLAMTSIWMRIIRVSERKFVGGIVDPAPR